MEETMMEEGRKEGISGVEMERRASVPHQRDMCVEYST